MSGRGRRGRGSALGRARGAFRLLGVLALACALAGAAGEPRAQGTGTGTAPAQAAGTRAQAKVSVRGVVVDQKLQVPLPGVSVTLVEAGLTVTTDEEGRYAFDGVAAGAYTLLAEREGYAPISMRLAAAALTAEVRVELPSQSVVTEQETVVAPKFEEDKEVGVLEERKEAAAAQDAVSSEVFGQAGAGDAAAALKMVVGTSVQGGKYATVRGMGDRYTGTTMNGVRLPNADPRRRAVQMDLFPTGAIESIAVTKTFTPDLQGDFTGGGVDVRTRSIPDGRILSVNFSTEVNSEATGNDQFLSYREGGVSTLGFGTDERALPEAAQGALPELPSPTPNPTPEQVQAAAAYDQVVRSFSPVMGVTRRTPGANTGMSLVAGNWYQVGRGVVGAMGSFTYAHKYDAYTNGRNNSAGVSDPAQGITLTHQRRDSKGTDELLEGLLGNLVWQPSDRHELSLRAVATHASEDEARYQVESMGYPSVEQNQTLQYTERDLRSNQLHGVHRLGDRAQGLGWEIDWSASDNRTRQQEPDVRFFRNSFSLETLTAERPSNSTDAQNTRRIFRDIEEDNTQGRVDVKVPFLRFGSEAGYVKAGLSTDATDRAYDQRSFTYFFSTQLGSFLDPLTRENRAKARYTATDPSQLWTDVFLSPDRIGLAANGMAPNQLLWVIVPVGNDVDYTGDQGIDAGYAMVDFPLMRRLRFVGGARYERTRIDMFPETATGSLEIIHQLDSGDREIVLVPEAEAAASLDEENVLPSVNLVWHPHDAMNVRASWTRTLARPTFRELAPVATEEFIFGDEYMGNPDLRLSRITNLDLRWEWFRRPGEVLAASAFTKDIRDPIELVSFSAGGRTFLQPLNYERGRVRGAEIEARTGLDLLGSWLQRVSVGGNLAWIDSEVDVPAAERTSLAAFGLEEDTRRLQGQPEYVANLSLTYDNDDTATSIGAFYNRTGETLVSGAARGTSDGNPSVYDEPFDSLDLSFSQGFRKHLTLTLRAKNVLAQTRTSVFRTPRGEEAVKSERDTARLVGLGLGIKW